MDKQELLKEYERVKIMRDWLSNEVFEIQKMGHFEDCLPQTKEVLNKLARRLYDLRHQLGIADDDLTR